MKWVGIFQVRIFWAEIFRREFSRGEFDGWGFSGWEFSPGGDFPRTVGIVVVYGKKFYLHTLLNSFYSNWPS